MKLKRTMTFEEMAAHMAQHSFKHINRVNVGKYARMKGFQVYKCMVDRKRYFYYVNPDLQE
nr:MAG TPA: hypothetical protein [Caudoviricetes sp.]